MALLLEPFPCSSVLQLVVYYGLLPEKNFTPLMEKTKDFPLEVPVSELILCDKRIFPLSPLLTVTPMNEFVTFMTVNASETVVADSFVTAVVHFAESVVER